MILEILLTHGQFYQIMKNNVDANVDAFNNFLGLRTLTRDAYTSQSQELK